MDVREAAWRKSTHSSSNGGSCIEVADNLTEVVLVRDTKNRDGGTLTFTREAWSAFVGHAAQHL